MATYKYLKGCKPYVDNMSATTKTKMGTSVATAFAAASLLVSSPEQASARPFLRIGIGIPAITAQIGSVAITTGGYYAPAPIVCVQSQPVIYITPVSQNPYPVVYVNGVACVMTFDIYGGRHLYRLRRGR